MRWKVQLFGNLEQRSSPLALGSRVYVSVTLACVATKALADIDSSAHLDYNFPINLQKSWVCLTYFIDEGARNILINKPLYYLLHAQ